MSTLFGYISNNSNMKFADIRVCMDLMQNRKFDDELGIKGWD